MSITHRFKNRFIKDNLITSDTKSIGDFEKTVNELYNDNSSYGNRGWAFEVFTEAYLKHIRMENEVYVYDSIPYDIRKKLGLTTKDLGVDGIFKQNGEWASYQCKFRGQRDIIPFEDISTFFASSENFKYRYVITNSNQIGKNAQHIQRVSTIGHFDFDKLTPDDFQKILKAIRGKRVSYKPYTPLDHQIQGINAAKKYFKNNDRGQYNWACGTGKTLGAMFTADKLNAKSIIVYVPSLMLATQFRDDWLDSHTEFSKDLKFVFVASDKDLGKRDSYSDFSYPVTTDVDELQSLINNFERNNERYVIISTYQSSHVVVALKNHKIDFAVYDEAHRLAGKKQSKFANALKTKAHKHLFMTATPRIIKSKTKDAEKHIVSMDNKRVFGDVINEITFAKAKELKLVTDLKLMIVVIDKKLDEQELRESTTMLDGEEIRSEQVACQVALKKAYKKIQEPVKKIITFHKTIKGAHDFVKFGMNKIIPNLNFYETISSEIPTLQRQELIERYRESKTAIISNARCLGEGTNVKSINIGMFVDPKQSTIDIIQNVGRLIRTTNEYKKDHGYVIIPLFVDSDKFKDGEILNEDEIEHTNYRSLLKIMEAMMSMDKTIFDKAEYEGDGISTNKKSIRGVLRRILKEDVEIIGPSLNLNEIENSIDTIFVERFVGFMPFNEARDIVHGLKLKGVKEWKQYCKSGNRNKYIPATPNQVYKDEWKGMGDWLGTGRIADQFKVYRSFKDARKFARSLKLKSGTEWKRYCKSGNKPDDIPVNPNNTYKDEWKGMGDWLGTGNVANFNKVFRPFKDARKFVHGLKLKSRTEWKRYCKSGKKPDDIPSSPNNTYKDEWKGWGDWLGTGRIADQFKVFRPFEKARKFVHGLNLKSRNEWEQYCKSGKKPDDIPVNPNNTYKDEWKSWGDWLGTGRIAPRDREYRSFKDARKFARSLKLKGVKEWRQYCKSGNKPDDIPNAPHCVYKDEWKGFGDWLGKK